MLSRFLGGKVTKEDGMFGFMAGAHVGGDVISNGWVGRWVDRDRKGSAQCCSVGGSWLNEANEILVANLVIGTVTEQWVEDLAESSEVVI